MESLENKMANATKWSSLAEVASKLISPIVNMVLARALTPSAFGIVATVNIIITFAEVFQDAGFQKYLIQHEFSSKESFEKSANVAFWTNLVLSGLIWFLICIFRQPLSVFVNNTVDLGNEIAIASISLPIFAFSSIQISICKRNFNFRKLFWVRLITSVIPLIVTVPLAFIMKNHWALIIGTLVRNVVQSLVLLKGSWKPKFCYSFLRLRGMLSFCIWTLAESITIWLTANAGAFVVTRTLGLEIVGLYKTAMGTVTGIIGIVSAATVSVSSLSRAQNDELKFKKIFFDYQKIVGLFVIPLGAGMFLYRHLLTVVLLGKQWSACVDFLGGYAFVCAIAIITNSFFSEYYRAKGKPRVSMLAQLLYLCILVPATYFSSKVSFIALYQVTCLLVLAFTFIHLGILKVYFCEEIGSMLKNLLLLFIPTLIMMVASLALQRLNENYLWQIVTIALSMIVYLISVFLIKPIRSWIRDSELTSGIYLRLRRVVKR